MRPTPVAKRRHHPRIERWRDRARKELFVKLHGFARGVEHNAAPRANGRMPVELGADRVTQRSVQVVAQAGYEVLTTQHREPR